jgi:uncharacterized SAM-binding protein YcdF (DUF218 family)
MKKKFVSSTLAIAGLFFLVLYLFPEFILTKVSEVLVYEDALVPAEAIVVLTGSWSGNRISGGASLFKKGFGKFVIFAGYDIYPGTNIYVLMKNYAVQLGVSEKNILIQPEISGELSTWGEGQAILKLLREKDIKNFILVTSKFHTRRAHAVYKKLINESKTNIKFQVYGAKDPDVPVKNWWKTRLGRKVIFMEYLKTLNNVFAY